MRKIASLILAIVMLLASFSFTACAKTEDTSVIELNVYNWEDYIAQDSDADLISEFESYYYDTYGKRVKVNYSTFGTNENMYNELQLSKVKTANGYDYGYDLVCPSDYMLQKMIYEGMVEKLDYSIAEGEEGSLYNYERYVSNHIYTLFKNQTDIDGNYINWNEYAIPYMFGTMGFVYNPEVLSRSGEYVVGDELKLRTFYIVTEEEASKILSEIDCSEANISIPQKASFKTACRYTANCCLVFRSVSTPLSSSENSSSIRATM